LIQSIDLIKLRNAEFIQFCKDFTVLLQNNGVENLSVQSHYTAMVAKVSELESLFKNELSSPLTAEIEDLDIQRDKAITGIIAAINAFVYHYDSSVADAAVVLQNNLKL